MSKYGHLDVITDIVNVIPHVELTTTTRPGSFTIRCLRDSGQGRRLVALYCNCHHMIVVYPHAMRQEALALRGLAVEKKLHFYESDFGDDFIGCETQPDDDDDYDDDEADEDIEDEEFLDELAQEEERIQAELKRKSELN